MGARRTWKEQEINEATASSNLSSFRGLIHLLFSSHMGFSTSKMGMTAGICFHGSTTLHALCSGHPPPLSPPVMLPMTAQGTSSRPSPCYRWVSPFCIAVTQKMTAVMTAVLTPALPKHLFSLQVFCLPQAFCKPCGNGEIRQKQGRAGSSVLNPKAGCPLLTAPSEPHHHVQRRLQTRAELPAL